MFISREATSALNDYLNRVNLALPSAPSQRISLVDKLYHQIMVACETKAREAGKLEVDLDTLQTHLASLGSPEQQAEQIVAEERRWSTDAFSPEGGTFNEKVSDFAKAAAERGEYVFRVSIETAANALAIAAQKLHEAADKMKSKA
jgi:hypothetical protein